MGIFNSDGSVNSSFKVAAPAANKVAARTPIDWDSIAANTPGVSASDQRISKSFQSLPAQNRLDTLNQLQTAAEKGDTEATRKLQFLVPQAHQNVPTDPDYTNKVASFVMGAGHLLGEGAKAAYHVANTVALANPEAAKFANKPQAVKDLSKAADFALSSIPETEAGTAGGGENQAENAQTNNGPSVKSLSAQALIPGALKGGGKVVGKLIASKVGSVVPAAVREATDVLGGETPQTASNVLEKHVAEPVPATGGSTRIAQDFNPNESIPHDIVPAEQLHPGARQVFSEIPKIAEGDVKGAPLARDATASTYHNLGAQTEQLAKGMSDHDLKLIDDIEIPTPKSGQTITASRAADQVERVAAKADNPEQFKAVVDSMKQGKDTRYLSDTAGLGRDMGYVHNHLTHVYETNGAPSEFTPENPTPGYTKQRVIATKAEAERLSQLTDENGNKLYPHLKPADVNAVEAHVQSMRAAAYEHGDEAFRGGIAQAHPGAVVGDMANGQYGRIQLPNGTDASNIYNRRLSPTRPNFPYGVRTADGHVLPVKDGNVVKALKDNPDGKLVNAATGENLHSGKIARIVRSAKTNPLGAYDKANGAVKTSVLGGGTFHAATTTGTVAGQQLVRLAAHPLQAGGIIADNARLIAGTVSKAAHAANLARFTKAGVTDFARQVGATLGTGDGLGTDTGKIHIPVISDIHDMVFNRQIPEAKLMIMKQSMDTKFPGMDYAHPTPEQVQYGRNVASAVNNLGGINRNIEGFTPRTAKVLSRVVLAPDYTEGKFRTIANALTQGGPKGNIARQMVVGKSVLFALPGIVALTAAGKINWNDPKQVAQVIGDQFLDPSVPLGYNAPGTATNPNGVPQSVHLPTTFVSELGKIIKPIVEPMDTYSGSRTSGIESYVTNRIAALPGAASRIVENKDFYGNPIITGGPVKSAENIASQFAPIPVAQVQKTATGQQPISAAILDTLGGRVSSDTSSPAAVHSTGINEYYNTLDPVQKQKSALVKQINKLATSGQQNQAARLAQEWNDALASKFTGLTTKYPKYDPTKDSNFTSLKISPKASAINKRASDSTAALKVLSQFQ